MKRSISLRVAARWSLLGFILLTGCGALRDRPVLFGKTDDVCVALCDRHFRPGAAALGDGKGGCTCWAPLENWESRARSTTAVITYETRPAAKSVTYAVRR